jgi:hypothetical protein
MPADQDQSEMAGLPLKQGAVYGALSFVVGYLITAVVIVIGETEEFTEDMLETTGWIYYNAQFADIETTVDGGELGALAETSFNYLTDDQIFGQAVGLDVPSVVYHLIPVAVLVATGYVLATEVNAQEITDGAVAGATLSLGTTVLAVVGTFLFTINEQSLSISPVLIDSVLLVGVVFPVVFGAIGGAISTE